jgi:hypothetical protein
VEEADYHSPFHRYSIILLNWYSITPLPHYSIIPPFQCPNLPVRADEEAAFHKIVGRTAVHRDGRHRVQPDRVLSRVRIGAT